MRLAVLGDPLRYTRSPDLHRAGLAALGRECTSCALPTPRAILAERLRELAAAGLNGVNLTAPLKEAALGCVTRASERARRARSVNTIGFADDHWWGETTDGEGFVDWLASLGRRPAEERVVLLGAGGAARSLGLALAEAGAAVSVAARDPVRAAASWTSIEGPELVAWNRAGLVPELTRASLVVNASPLGARDLPIELAALRRDALVVDLGYQSELTALVVEARRAGRAAHDGLGLLVFQARRSLALWTGEDVAVEPLAAAVGWPR